MQRYWEIFAMEVHAQGQLICPLSFYQVTTHPMGLVVGVSRKGHRYADHHPQCGTVKASQNIQKDFIEVLPVIDIYFLSCDLYRETIERWEIP